MKESVYYGYVKSIWSKDFKKVVHGLSKISNNSFLIKEDKRVLFKIDEGSKDEVIDLLSQTVQQGAWNDLVNKEELIVIFGPGDIEKVSLGAPANDPTFKRMKDFEPSIRKHLTIRDMVNASAYASCL